MDLLLTHGYFLAEDAHERKYMKPYPPLGLLYLSAYLKRAGFAVEVADTTFAERADLEDRLDRREAPVLGIYTNLMTRLSVVRIIERAKAAGWTVVLGGPESANYPAQYLRAGGDVVVFGEGEATLAELLPALAAGGRKRGTAGGQQRLTAGARQLLANVAGIAYLDAGGELVRTPARAKLRDLDALPWPDRTAIDIGAYLDCWREHHGAGSVNLITARGCPYRCRWCSHAVFGYTHARRSASDVADEVAHIRTRYDPELLWYADDVFSISPRWLRAFADEMTARDLVLPYECITRADRVDAAVVDDMRRLGCYRVWLGSESGSQSVLDAMARGVTLEQVHTAADLFRAAGIEVGMFLMWGYEGETEADIAATVEHVKRVAPDRFLTTVAYPIKGTPYFEQVADRVVSDGEWREVTDRDYRVAGRHSQRYYRYADEWLRGAVALHEARDDLPRAGWRAVRGAARALRGRLGMRLTAGQVEA